MVTALDITHDPANGMDVHALVRKMTAGGGAPHPNCAYIISNRQVARRTNGWQWVKYNGSHPHDMHAHIAVGNGTDGNPTPQYDDTTSWRVAELLRPPAPPAPEPEPEEDEMTDKDRALLEEAVRYGKLARVSDVARSHDMEIIKAMIGGEKPETIDALEAAKAKDVRETKAALGL